MGDCHEQAISAEQLLEAARTQVFARLCKYYTKMPPTVIQVMIACIDQSRLEQSGDILSFQYVPDSEELAVLCKLDHNTIISALATLTDLELITDRRLTMELERVSVHFKYEVEGGRVVFHASDKPWERAPALTPAATPSSQGALAANGPARLATPQQQDFELIARYQAGDQSAFAELYTRYFHKVRLQAARYLTESESYDATQQIFMALMEKLKSFRLDGEAKFTTWLYRFTELSLANERRKNAREMQMSSLSEDFDIRAFIRLTSPEQQMLPYLLSLDVKQRECVYLYYYEEMTYEEISEKLGIDLKKVRTDLQTARRHIRKLLFKEKDSELDKSPQPAGTSTFYETLDKEIRKAEQEGKRLILCILACRSETSESDHHLAEKIEQQLSTVLFSSIRQPGDIVLKLGAGQFAIMLKSDAKVAHSILERIKSALQGIMGRPIVMSAVIAECHSSIALSDMLQQVFDGFSDAVISGEIITMPRR